MANWKTTLPVAPIIDLTIKARITVFLFFNLFHVGGFLNIWPEHNVKGQAKNQITKK